MICRDLVIRRPVFYFLSLVFLLFFLLILLYFHIFLFPTIFPDCFSNFYFSDQVLLSSLPAPPFLAFLVDIYSAACTVGLLYPSSQTSLVIFHSGASTDLFASSFPLTWLLTKFLGNVSQYYSIIIFYPRSFTRSPEVLLGYYKPNQWKRPFFELRSCSSCRSRTSLVVYLTSVSNGFRPVLTKSGYSWPSALYPSCTAIAIKISFVLDFCWVSCFC